MKEEQIKEMLLDIINNGAEYEFTYKDSCGNYVPCRKYKLGYEIDPDCEYRKVEKKKTWMEENVNDMEEHYGWTKDKLYNYIFGYKTGINEVCKKILEEFEEKLPGYIDTGKNCLLRDVKEIIKDLGVKI